MVNNIEKPVMVTATVTEREDEVLRLWARIKGLRSRSHVIELLIKSHYEEMVCDLEKEAKDIEKFREESNATNDDDNSVANDD